MTPAPDTTGPSPQRSMARAALLGLCGGMFIGGLMLLGLGIRGLWAGPGCEGLSKLECELVVDAARHVGRVQTICGGALVALGLCLLVLARPYFSGSSRGSAPHSGA